MRKIIVVREPKEFNLGVKGVEVVSSKDYLTDPKYAALSNVRIFNLARSYSYQSRGYYVSLLAEARGQKVIPDVKSILDLRSPRLVKVLSRDLQGIIQQHLAHKEKDQFELSIYFGRNVNRKYDRLAHELYKVFRSPLLRARFAKSADEWELRTIRPVPYNDIPEEHLPFVKRFAQEYFTKKRHHLAPEDRSSYDLAILVNAEDKAAPSNKRAIVKFRQAAERMGFAVDIIGPDDIDRVAEYDALLIRENTHVDDHTYRFARKAQKEGLAVNDAPDAILKCNNKVFLAEVMLAHDVPTPRTMIVHSENRDEVAARLGMPVVLKLPDSTFSIGVTKAKTAEELEQKLDELLQESDLAIAQEYMPSDFDWRIGVLDGKPLYACKYFMARGHWQIYNWGSDTKKHQTGDFATMPVEEAPKAIVDAAVKAVLAVVGDHGLFGVDVKEHDGKPYVIEVNECPNIDHGVEDVVLGDALYEAIIGSLKRSIERKIGNRSRPYIDKTMSNKAAYKLFEVTGIELEYMVVERGTLKVLPIVDKLFEDVTGAITSDVERGDVEWSNELVSHVVELKTAKPTKRIPSFRKKFAGEVQAINAVLAKRNAMLLPTAAHPLMDPFTETVIWPHEHNEVYALYNRIFDCRGHGWSNLQSTHLNLPFATDEEFGKLHAAVRMVLPLIPALTASSPLLDGKATGYLDSRMEAYLHHQDRLPQLMGSLIPEAVFTQEDYYREIFGPIGKALAPFDTENVMDHHFANSRGAIARFDRGAIELRVIDIQECPAADLAIAELIVALTGAMTKGRWTSTYLQRAWNEGDLLAIFKQVIRDAGNAEIMDRDFLVMFGVMKEERMTAQRLWEHITNELRAELSEGAQEVIAHILKHGCLAQRILARTGTKPSADMVRKVYTEIAECLQGDRPFA